MIRSNTFRPQAVLAGLFMLLVAGACVAQGAPATTGTAATQAEPPGYDAALAERLGADDYGMRKYVLVILKTGPTPLPRGEARDAMFQGHFANMKRLAAEGKLVLAGPLDGVDGRRGIFVFDTADLDEARALVATDPVIVNGEMEAELHAYYGSAALLLVNEAHGTISRKSF